MKASLTSIAKKSSYILAACIIFAALLVCVGHFVLTPLVEKHRQDLEKMASGYLDAPVTIKEAEISWYRYQPVINLNQVTVENKTTHESVLQIKQIRVSLSLFKSLWQRKAVLSSVMIVGSAVVLHQSETGEIEVQGFPAFGAQHTPYQSETKFIDVLNWLSQQPRLILQNIDVRYTGFNEAERYVTLHELNFENKRNQHHISGDAILHQALPTEVKLGIDWEGERVDLAKIKAKIYLYVKALALTQWTKNKTWHNK